VTLLVVYYSTKSENTHRFVAKLDLPSIRLPIKSGDAVTLVERPYVIAFPSYGGGASEGSIPNPVKDFLNIPSNRDKLMGVIALGNTNFGEAFCLGGRLVSRKCNVPLVGKIEIMGTPEDIVEVKNAIQLLEEEILNV